MKTGGFLPYDCDFPNVWIDQRHDIAAVYWDRYHYTNLAGIEHDDTDPWSYLREHIARGQQVLIDAQSVFAFPYFDRSRNSRAHSDWRQILSEELDEIASWKDYLVCLKMVALHMTAEQAFRTDLFGITGEELVRLVDPMDTEQIQRFSRECDPEDETAKEFFDLALDTETFHHHLNEWKKNMVDDWFCLMWLKASRDDSGAMLKPEDIWIGLPDKSDESWGLLDFMSKYRAIVYNVDLYTPNMDHPWVKAVFDEMPSFQPTIMFRLCVIRCYKIPETDKDVLRFLPQSPRVDDYGTYYPRVANPEYTKLSEERDRIEKEENDKSKDDKWKMQRRSGGSTWV